MSLRGPHVLFNAGLTFTSSPASVTKQR